MEMKFAVHNPHTSPLTVDAEVQGQPVQAVVSIFECELMSLDGRSGTFKFRSAPNAQAVDEARALFQPDVVVIGTFQAEVAPESDVPA